MARDVFTIETTEVNSNDEWVYKSTHADQKAMQRLGRSQELVRHYNIINMISFVVIATQAWQLTLFSASPAIIDGGLPSFVWSVLWCIVGFVPVILSMAEMASMAPIAGAQYHWVSEFAPENCQRMLSYVTGWTSTLAWQAGNATGLFLSGTLIQCIILVNVPDYSFPNWHASLFAIAMIVLATSINIWGSWLLPHVQTPICIASVILYIAILAALWAEGPQATSQQVWLDWSNTSGWPSMALAVFIGQLPALNAFTGIDTTVHMAEEIRNAPNAVPKIMMAVLAANGVLNFLTTVTMAYHLPDPAAALADPTTYPAIYMLSKAMSRQWVTCVLVLICLFLMIGNLSYLAAVSRDLFAFARDNGLPFSSWIARVDPKKKIPVNAYILTGVFCGLLSLIYIGNSVAFYAIVSLSGLAAFQCYLFSIGSILWRRVYLPESLPKTQFSLGKWGIPINGAAIIFSFWAVFWCSWPQMYPVTAESLNWAPAIFIATVGGSVIYYLAYGKKKYVGPVFLIEERKQ